jgi:hypothetical protein
MDEGGGPVDAGKPLAAITVRDLEVELRDVSVPRGQRLRHGGPVRQE